MSSNEEPRLEGASETRESEPVVEAAPNPIWAIVGFAILLALFYVIDRLQGP